jgi:hypothetical protein
LYQGHSHLAFLAIFFFFFFFCSLVFYS